MTVHLQLACSACPPLLSSSHHFLSAGLPTHHRTHATTYNQHSQQLTSYNWKLYTVHHSLSPLAAWKTHQCTMPADTNWNRNTGTCLSETSEVCQWAEMASDWNVASNQQSFIDHATHRSVTRLFYCVSQSEKQTVWTYSMMCFSIIGNCHDFSSLRYCCYEH